MNPLYRAPMQTSKPTLKEFMDDMTPAGAKAKVEQLLSSGQMSPQQFEQLKSQAKQIARNLGMK